MEEKNNNPINPMVVFEVLDSSPLSLKYFFIYKNKKALKISEPFCY